LPEVDGVTVLVGEDLDLNVTRLLDVFFEVDTAILERLLRFLTGGVEPGLKAQIVVGDAHTASAAAGRRLDEYRIAHFAGQRQRLLGAFEQARAAGHNRDAGLLRHLARLVLVAQALHGLRRRADEGDTAFAADIGEVGVLGQEPITGVDGLDI